MTGQSVADLLAIHATAYHAVKVRTLTRLLREAQHRQHAQRVQNQRALMADLKSRMGR